MTRNASFKRRIRARKELPEVGWGECSVVDCDAPSVLVLRYDWRSVSFVTVHNFSDKKQTVRFDVSTDDGGALFDVFDDDHTLPRRQLLPATQRHRSVDALGEELERAEHDVAARVIEDQRGDEALAMLLRKELEAYQRGA